MEEGVPTWESFKKGYLTGGSSLLTRAIQRTTVTSNASASPKVETNKVEEMELFRENLAKMAAEQNGGSKTQDVISPEREVRYPEQQPKTQKSMMEAHVAQPVTEESGRIGPQLDELYNSLNNVFSFWKGSLQSLTSVAEEEQQRVWSTFHGVLTATQAQSVQVKKQEPAVGRARRALARMRTELKRTRHAARGHRARASRAIAGEREAGRLLGEAENLVRSLRERVEEQEEEILVMKEALRTALRRRDGAAAIYEPDDDDDQAKRKHEHGVDGIDAESSEDPLRRALVVLLGKEAANKQRGRGGGPVDLEDMELEAEPQAPEL